MTTSQDTSLNRPLTGDLETTLPVLEHCSQQMTAGHDAEVELSRLETNALQFG